jgi:hypothetical protein
MRLASSPDLNSNIIPFRRWIEIDVGQQQLTIRNFGQQEYIGPASEKIAPPFVCALERYSLTYDGESTDLVIPGPWWTRRTLKQKNSAPIKLSAYIIRVVGQHIYGPGEFREIKN